MNWYPFHTKLYRRRSKNDPSAIELMGVAFDELKPFFMMMEKSIRSEAESKLLVEIKEVIGAFPFMKLMDDLTKQRIENEQK